MKNLGLLLAGIWFVLTGLVQLFGLGFRGMSVAMGALALVAGVLLVVRR